MESLKQTKTEIMNGIDCIKSKIIDHNTVEYYLQDGTRVIRYHNTDIIKFLPDKSIWLNTSGFKTSTTKERLNNFQPYQIYQNKSIWYIKIRGREYIFQDGITISKFGKITGVGSKKALQKLNKQITKYVNGYVEELSNRRLDKPDGGDCWLCLLKETKTAKSLGDLSNNTDHLLSHFKEKYYVPSLLVNAIDENPVAPMVNHQIGYYLKYHDQSWKTNADFINNQIKMALKRYLRKRLGLSC